MKVMVWIGIPTLLFMGAWLIYDAWFGVITASSFQASLFLTVMGILIMFIGVLAFVFRKKIWSIDE